MKITWVGGFEREEDVWGVKRQILSREIREKRRENCTDPLYRKTINLNRSKGVEI